MKWVIMGCGSFAFLLTLKENEIFIYFLVVAADCSLMG